MGSPNCWTARRGQTREAFGRVGVWAHGQIRMPCESLAHAPGVALAPFLTLSISLNQQPVAGVSFLAGLARRVILLCTVRRKPQERCHTDRKWSCFGANGVMSISPHSQIRSEARLVCWDAV